MPTMKMMFHKFSLRILQCCGLVGPPGVPNEGAARAFVYRYSKVERQGVSKAYRDGMSPILF